MLAFLLLAALQPQPAEETPLTLDSSVEAAAEAEGQGADTTEAPADEAPADEAPAPDTTAGASGVSEADVKAVADALETGFRTCVQQVANRAHVSRAREEALKKEGVDLDQVAPEEVATYGKGRLPDDRLIAKITSKTGNVWLTAFPDLPQCIVTVSDTAAAPAAREEINTRMSGNKDWSSDSSRSHTANGVERKAWTQAAGLRGTRLLMQLDGPEAPADGGAGIQAIMTIAFIDAKAN